MPTSHSEVVARAWVLAQPLVDAFIAATVRNHADAQDILQDVAVAVLDANSHPPIEGGFTPWAIGIARHKIADYYRRKERLQVILADHILTRVAEAFAGQSDTWTAEGHALELCLDRVRGDSKRLLELRYRDGYLPQEMARQLGRTSEAIRASLLRIRRSLRDCIERRLSQSREFTTSGGA